jgi:hypothetical protein
MLAAPLQKTPTLLSLFRGREAWSRQRHPLSELEAFFKPRGSHRSYSAAVFGVQAEDTRIEYKSRKGNLHHGYVF